MSCKTSLISFTFINISKPNWRFVMTIASSEIFVAVRDCFQTILKRAGYTPLAMSTWGRALWWMAVLWQIRWQDAAKLYLQAAEVAPPWKSHSHIKSWMVWRGNFRKIWIEGATWFPNGLKGQHHERHLLAITSVLFHRPAGLSFASFCQTKLFFSKLLLNQKKIKRQLCWTQQ